MDGKQKLFAFKLAAKAQKTDEKWQARKGVSAAGCTEYRFPYNYRYSSATWGADQGAYC